MKFDSLERREQILVVLVHFGDEKAHQASGALRKEQETEKHAKLVEDQMFRTWLFAQ